MNKLKKLLICILISVIGVGIIYKLNYKRVIDYLIIGNKEINLKIKRKEYIKKDLNINELNLIIENNGPIKRYLRESEVLIISFDNYELNNSYEYLLKQIKRYAINKIYIIDNENNNNYMKDYLSTKYNVIFISPNNKIIN